MFWKKKKNKRTDPEQAAQTAGMLPLSTIKVVIKTDLGNIRTNNEDSASFFQVKEENAQRDKGCLLMVADGMGGHLAGEVASKMAVDTISEEYFKPDNWVDKEKLLDNAFRAANKKIFDLASENVNYKGMGTTCTSLAIVGHTIFYAHAGDSRAYLFKNKSLLRITEDHTYVQELVKNGDISKEEAEQHPQRNILTNAMGTKPNMRVDTGRFIAKFDLQDRLLICSDGLYDYLSDAEIAAVMAYPTLDEAANYFIAEAKRRGGKDNITVALAERIALDHEINLKSTRDIDLPAMTRDADLPAGINHIDYDR